MSDLLVGSVTFQGAGQLPNPSNEGETPTVPSDVVTRKELNEFRAEYDRKIQSATDKAESRLNKQISDKLKQLQAMSPYMTPEQVKTARETIVQEAYVAAGNETDISAPPAAQPKMPETVTQPGGLSPDEAAREIMEAAGVVIEDGDPEAATLNRTSPQAYLLSVRKACQEKNHRIQQAPPQARIPTMGGGNVSNNSLTEQYKTEMLANRGKGMDVAEQIKEKYRKLNLDVDSVSFR